MTTLTLYTENYDLKENIVNRGMSGLAFIDIDDEVGMSFKSLDEALDYCTKSDINLNAFEINYLSQDGIQMFKKFKIV